jgi:hypothetical protein
MNKKTSATAIKVKLASEDIGAIIAMLRPKGDPSNDKA